MTGFNADEIFEMALQVERNGGRFYRQAAETTEGETRDLLLRLAAMEDEHLEVFTRLKDKLGPSMAFDPDKEGARYLQFLTEGKVFPISGDQKLTGKETAEEILGLAIGFEKETVVFFTGIRDAVQGEEAKRSVAVLINQEMGHVADLSARLLEIRRG